LLGWARAELESIAQQWQLRWCEDESNQICDFDRNYLRHEIMPGLKQRWPAAAARLAQNAVWNREADQILDEVAQQDLQLVAADALSLDLNLLQQLTPERQRKLLRFWLLRQPCGLPGEGSFQRIFTEMIPARPDAEPELRWSDAILRRYR